MSGFRSFVRQLGFQPGVQLNPLADQTDGAVLDNSDQIFGVIMRTTRGRIDRPFRVNRTNLMVKTGPAEAIRVNALNEAKLQAYEALENGAYEAVVQRLVPAAAVKSYATINFSGTPTNSAETVAYATSPTAPTTGFSISVMHHDCFNDGIKLALHADATPVVGTAVANAEVTLRVLDVKGNVLHEFTGSLDPAAKDDFGNSKYLPDVAAKSTASVELAVATGATVPTTSDAYGRDATGKPKWATSGTLICFTEGGTTYTTDDYDRAISAMRNTVQPYGYLISGGTQNLSFLGKLASLAIETNMHLDLDIDGKLSVDAALAFAQSLNIDSHYVRFHWAPLEAEDPMNGGRAVWGVSGLHVGLSCARNARINARGFAPKNYPVAGKQWSINRKGVRQTARPTEQELSDCAKVQINPAIFEIYNGGGLYVFTDSLTAAKTVVSYKKLQSVAEMSAHMDNAVTLYAKELLQLPMKEFIKRMTAFMDTLLSAAQASDWLKPAANLPNGAAYAFTIKPNEARPADVVNIDYFTSYDGVARQVIVQQTLVK